MMADCILYGRIVTGFTFAFMLQNVFQTFLIAAERPNLGLLITLAAGVTNMVLDALFVAVFRLGYCGRCHCNRHQPDCRRRTAPDVLPAAKSSPLRLRPDEVRSAAPSAIVRQRLIRADEQHFLLADWDAVQFHS